MPAAPVGAQVGTSAAILTPTQFRRGRSSRHSGGNLKQFGVYRKPMSPQLVADIIQQPNLVGERQTLDAYP